MLFAISRRIIVNEQSYLIDVMRIRSFALLDG